MFGTMRNVFTSNSPIMWYYYFHDIDISGNYTAIQCGQNLTNGSSAVLTSTVMLLYYNFTFKDPVSVVASLIGRYNGFNTARNCPQALRPLFLLFFYLPRSVLRRNPYETGIMSLQISTQPFRFRRPYDTAWLIQLHERSEYRIDLNLYSDQKLFYAEKICDV